jgi:hypothetical protein
MRPNPRAGFTSVEMLEQVLRGERTLPLPDDAPYFHKSVRRLSGQHLAEYDQAKRQGWLASDWTYHALRAAWQAYCELTQRPHARIESKRNWRTVKLQINLPEHKVLSMAAACRVRDLLKGCVAKGHGLSVSEHSLHADIKDPRDAREVIGPLLDVLLDNMMDEDPHAYRQIYLNKAEVCWDETSDRTTWNQKK